MPAREVAWTSPTWAPLVPQPQRAGENRLVCWAAEIQRARRPGRVRCQPERGSMRIVLPFHSPIILHNLLYGRYFGGAAGACGSNVETFASRTHRPPIFS